MEDEHLDEPSIKSDDDAEEIKAAPKLQKEKKPRTPAQIEAFKRAQQKRIENAKIKNSLIAEVKQKSKEGTLPEQKKVAKKKYEPTPEPETDTESEEEIIVLSKNKKPKKKVKKTKVIYDDTTTEEEDEEYTPPPKRRNKIEYQQPIQSVQQPQVKTLMKFI